MRAVRASLYDLVNGRIERAGLADRRRELLRHARGRVLEIGAGTGANLAHYPEGVEELVLVEPDRALARDLKGGRVVEAKAEALPFEDESFDTVVSTLVLCSVADPARALAEIRRVLRQDGELLFLEHVRSEDPGRARWQDRLDRPWWGLVSGGCHCNRETLAQIERQFAITEVEHGELPRVLPIVRPMIVGRAGQAEPATRGSTLAEPQA